MKTAFVKLFAIGLAVWASSFEQSHAVPFQNGGFETPQLGAGGLLFLNDTEVTGWLSTGDDGGNVLFNNGNGFAVSSEGNQGIILNDDDGGLTAMAQTFDTIANQPYRVDFDLSRENGAVGTAAISVIATGGVSTPYLATPSYLTSSYFFTNAGTSTTLTFSRSGTEGNSPLLDNVRITAVPEPGSLALLAVGAIGLWRVRKLRRG